MLISWLCAALLHNSSLISSGLCGRGRGLTETGPGPGIAVCLSVIRSGSVLLRRDLPLKPGLEIPRPPFFSSLPPAPGPFATKGSWLIYIAESCDGAPSLPSFCPPPPPPTSTSPPDNTAATGKTTILPEQKIGRGL